MVANRKQNTRKNNMKNKPTLITSLNQSSLKSNPVSPQSNPSSQTSPDVSTITSGPDMSNLPDLSQLLSQNQNQNPPISGSAKSGNKGGRNYKYDKLHDALIEQIGGVGLLLSILPKTQADGQVILLHSESLADRLIACAKENESFYKVLVMVTTGTVWTALSMELVAIVGAILKNHGVNPLAFIAKKQGNANDNVSTISQPA